MADELVQRRLERITTAEHVLEVLGELAARARRREASSSDPFQSGMKAGYIQAVQLLLGVPYDQAKQLVEEEWL